MRPCRVLHVSASLDPALGGPSTSTPELALACQRHSIMTGLATKQLGGAISTYAHKAIAAGVKYHAGASGRQLDALIYGYDIIHIHGMWAWYNHQVASLARKRGIPYVVSPKGMLSAWALRYHSWRKRLAWNAYQRHDLKHAVAMVCTSDMEAADATAQLPRQRTVIIPHGVDSDYFSPAEDVKRSGMLYLGRLHPVKGLSGLFRCLARCRNAFENRGWILCIAGSGEPDYEQHLIRQVEQAGIGHLVQFVGKVDPDTARELYRRAAVFVLPSHTENFSMSVAEALSCQTPVITTHGTPWSIIQRFNCGWWVPLGDEALLGAMHNAISISDASLVKMGRQARLLACETYSWPAIGSMAAGLYRSMI